MSVAGGALAVQGVRHRNALGSAVGVIGLGMFLRGVTNIEFKRLIGLTGRRASDIQKTITIAAPVERVFEFWSHYENLPRFMSHLREVRDKGNGQSHWVAAAPAGLSIEWDAEITRYIANRLLAWKSVPGSVVRNAGVIRFDANPDGTTRLTVRLTYNPPAGAIGHAFAKLLGADPKSALDDDLARFKSLIEFGKTTAHDETVTREQLSEGITPRFSAESGAGL